MKLIQTPLMFDWPFYFPTLGWWLYAYQWSLIWLIFTFCVSWWFSKPILVNMTLSSWLWPIGAGFIAWCCVCFVRAHGMAVG